MTRGWGFVGVGLAVLLPGAALAAGQAVQHVSLDSGVVGAWRDTSSRIAYSLLPFLFVVSLAVEAFGKPPTQPRDFGAVVWRLVVVLALLLGYRALFGGILGLAQDVADSVASTDTWDALVAAGSRFLEARARLQAVELAQSGTATEGLANLLALKADGLGGLLVSSTVTLIVFLGQAAHWIVGRLGTVLAILLYVLGPLALAGSVPRGSDVGTRWLRVFVSILCWPILSAMLAGLVAEYALKGLTPTSTYEATYDVVGVAGLLSLTAFAVPLIASALIGGSLHALSGGWASVTALAAVASGGVSSVGHVAGGVARAAGPARGAARVAAGALAAAAPAVGAAGGASRWTGKGGVGLGGPLGRVSPAADAALGRAAAARGAVDFPAARPRAPGGPPPFKWSQGGIAPAQEARPVGSRARPPPAQEAVTRVVPAVTPEPEGRGGR